MNLFEIYDNFQHLASRKCTMVELIAVSYSYNGHAVLDEVNVSFPPQQISVVFGKSGSGKTTLLKMINGMLEPDSGEVKISGRPFDYSQGPRLRLGIGYVVQMVGLFPHLTVEGNVGLLGKISGWTKHTLSDSVRKMMELVELPRKYLTRYPHELSGGEQQRAGLARALLLNPPLLLMDEPFASLDQETKHTIHQHFIRIQHAAPRTIILITHDAEEARTLGNEFFLMHDRKIAKHLPFGLNPSQ